MTTTTPKDLSLRAYEISRPLRQSIGKQILEALSTGPASDDDLQALIGAAKISDVTGSRNKLVHEGKIKDSGKRATNDRGNPVTLWELGGEFDRTKRQSRVQTIASLQAGFRNILKLHSKSPVDGTCMYDRRPYPCPTVVQVPQDLLG